MTRWNTAICETNGINIHYTRTGGNKLPLILLYGLVANGLCWTGLARVLEKEYIVSSIVAAELQRINPRLQTVQIREAGHSVHLDQPERFMVVVVSFLSSIGTISGS